MNTVTLGGTATINDLVAVVVYYGLAMIVLIDMFHLG